MRKGVAVIGLGCVALVVLACGGNVVVDGSAGSTTSGSTGGSTGTGGAPPACDNLSGEGLSGGGCQTNAVCNGKPVFIQCFPGGSGGGSSCSCQVNGSQAGTCQEAPGSANVCNPTSGCCASLVGG